MCAVFENTLRLTAVSPLILKVGFLVSVTCVEPRMRLKLTAELHSTVNTKQSLCQVILWLYSEGTEDLSVYSFGNVLYVGLISLTAKYDIYAAVKPNREAKRLA